MSSTNRGAERNKSDYYVTPIHEVEKFLKTWEQDEPNIKWTHRILDPCAGGTMESDGKVLIPMSYPAAIGLTFNYPDMIVKTMDIRPDSPAGRICDYLAADIDERPNLIITNPPFNLALDIITKALSDVSDGGFVVMLLRLNFFGSETRKAFFQSHMPERTYVYSNRFAFTPTGKGPTDSIEYCHMVWRKPVDGIYPTETKLKLI